MTCPAQKRMYKFLLALTRRPVYYYRMTLPTRDKILQSGAQLIHLKGYAATGLQEILQDAGVPKGSFYFYFRSKEDFGLALVEYYQQRLAELASPVTQDKTLTPLQRLSDFFTLFRNHFAQEGFVKGCPIGNLIQELGDVNAAFRTKLQTPMENLIRFVARQLHEAQERGELSEKLPAADTARFIISAWQGALLQMKVCAGPEPLDNFHQMVFNILLT